MPDCSSPSEALVSLEGLPDPAPLAAVAERLGVRPPSVRRWIASGRLKALRTAPAKGRVYVTRRALARFLAGKV